MRARLQRFLPIVLLALVMQVLAPIAACLAAGQAVADPFSAGAICHSPSEQGGPVDETGTPAAKAGACALCCLAHADALLDASPHAALSTLVRPIARVVWHVANAPVLAADDGSIAQARAPPRIS
ncbi:DUF2946 domain-containing protein [Bradyrhizobium sp. DOA9]|uniref:DUF2946 domain-containing protein n=1 Tax=Bradyrhizobium sp. DOA9 TaxID=1126627 RepID=UPI0004690646|nr:DUF2946 domain-containing protein [Bradyrhizobium sp. DOA9]